MVSSYEEAKKAVSLSKYIQREGEKRKEFRGLISVSRTAGYGLAIDEKTHLKTSNKEIMLIVQFETKEVVDNLDEILSPNHSLAAVLPHLPVRPSWCLTSGLTSLALKDGLRAKYLSMLRLTGHAKYGMEMVTGLKRLSWKFATNIRFRETSFPGQCWKIERSRYRSKML